MDSNKPFEIPQTIVIGFYNGNDVKILDIKDNLITFETSDKVIENKISMMFLIFNFNTYDYDEYNVENCELIDSQLLEFSVVYTIKFSHTTSISNHKFMNKIKDLKIDLKNNNVGTIITNLNNYKLEKEQIFFDTYNQQEKYWYDLDIENDYKLTFSKFISNIELAFSLNNRNKYRQFLDGNLSENIHYILKEKNLDGHPLFSKSFSRIYIGNEFCPLIFPDKNTLNKILDSALIENFDITISLPYIREKNINWVVKVLDNLKQWCNCNSKKIEIIINDWGILNLISSKYPDFIPILGRLLNKRKKDPRLVGKLGMYNLEECFIENNLNCNHFNEYLESLGVFRYEFETCRQKTRIPAGKHSIHFPFYQMNTSQYCTLYAICEKYHRSRQVPVSTCSHYCDEICFMYPKELNIVGYGNSIFGFDNSLLTSSDILKHFLINGIDRLVFDVL